jgi:hypothetical protein
MSGRSITLAIGSVVCVLLYDWANGSFVVIAVAVVAGVVVVVVI